MTDRISSPFGSVMITPGDHDPGLIDRMFGGGATPQYHNARVPPVDVVETADSFVVVMDLPGVRREDLNVDLAGVVVTVSAEARSFDPPDARWISHERRVGRYVRAINLSQSVDAQRIEAKYEDGILELTLPKPKSGATDAVAIEVK